MKEDHRSFAGVGVLFEPPARFVSVDARHHDVEQDEQRADAARHFEGTLAAAGHEQPIAPAVERVAQDVEVRGVIIDQQDAVGIVGRCGWRLVHAAPTP